ncbi:hypothetical protein Tco_1331857, partial [Tanacetum coccineum]
IIDTGEEGMGVIETSNDKKNTAVYEIVGFEVFQCCVNYDPEKMAKLHQYDREESLNCLLEMEKC